MEYLKGVAHGDEAAVIALQFQSTERLASLSSLFGLTATTLLLWFSLTALIRVIYSLRTQLFSEKTPL